jgi:hypothetical protein
MSLIGLFLLITMGAALFAGATVLWIRTRRVTALLQLLASSVVLLACAMHALASYLTTIDRNTLSDTLRTPRAHLLIESALGLGIFVFSLTYFLYALGHKRI